MTLKEYFDFHKGFTFLNDITINLEIPDVEDKYNSYDVITTSKDEDDFESIIDEYEMMEVEDVRLVTDELYITLC